MKRNMNARRAMPDFKALIPQVKFPTSFHYDHTLDPVLNIQLSHREKLQSSNIRIAQSQTLLCLVSISFGELIPL